MCAKRQIKTGVCRLNTSINHFGGNWFSRCFRRRFYAYGAFSNIVEPVELPANMIKCWRLPNSERESNSEYLDVISTGARLQTALANDPVGSAARAARYQPLANHAPRENCRTGKLWISIKRQHWFINDINQRIQANLSPSRSRMASQSVVRFRSVQTLRCHSNSLIDYSLITRLFARFWQLVDKG